jgi:hypothetical protein
MMAIPAIIQRAARLKLYICERCAIQASNYAGGCSKVSRRYIGLKYQAKQSIAEEEWQARAKQILSGDKQSMLSILEGRGLVDTIAGFVSSLLEVEVE